MSIFSIGVSGLHTAQQALNTTSNNISNVYTPGYNRELTQISESPLSGGARAIGVQRQFDYFIATQLNSATSNLSSLQSYQVQVGQIDNLLADRDAGLAPLIQNFFSALQDLSASPSDPAARQGVIGAADTLAAQFRSFDGYLRDLQTGINGQIENEVTQINNIADQLAGLNKEIILAKAKSGEAPNSLLNQRDALVHQLSERIDVRLSIQDGDSYNVTMGSGQPLVAGSQSFSLNAMASSTDPRRTVLGYQDSAGNAYELREDSVKGGSLGGLLRFREETLENVQNQLGRMAATLAMAFNEQHQQGLDLNGVAGAEFFAVGEPGLFSHAGNTGGAQVTAEFGDYQQLTGADYDIRVTDAAAGEFLITDRRNGQSNSVVLNGDSQLNIGGVIMTVADPALLQDGDRYQLQPTRYAAGNLENLIRDTGAIAAGIDVGSGDNRNALALMDLQSANLVGGNASLNGAYASIVSEVGNRSNIVQVNLAAQQSLTEQIKRVQQSESGVNLDEEAANLMRFQQYYQANAKVIEVGATLLDTLLGLRA